MHANSHTDFIPAAVITGVETALDAQLEALTSYSTPLTADDRRNLLKTGPKSFQFVELAHTLAGQNPQLTSKSFSMEAFTSDWNDAHNLLGMENRARQLLELIEDIRMAAGSDSLHHALEFYADVRIEAGRNVNEARAVYEQLKAAYPNKGRRRAAPE